MDGKASVLLLVERVDDAGRATTGDAVPGPLPLVVVPLLWLTATLECVCGGGKPDAVDDAVIEFVLMGVERADERDGERCGDTPIEPELESRNNESALSVPVAGG